MEDKKFFNLMENPERWFKETQDLGIREKIKICLKIGKWFEDTSEPEEGLPLLYITLEDGIIYPLIVFYSMTTKQCYILFNVLEESGDEKAEILMDIVKKHIKWKSEVGSEYDVGRALFYSKKTEEGS